MKIERVNEDGLIICEYCGKPIVKKYDCIGHHTIPLTDENVNNIEISLNPKLIQLVHHKCHNRIHGKGGMKRYYKEVYIVWGSPLAGKSTWVEENASDDDLILDINRIWQCAGMSHSNAIKSVVFAIRDTMYDCIKYKRGRWEVAYIVGGYPLISEREQIIRELGAREIFISTSKEECLKRITDDMDREAYTKYIEEWWRLSNI